MELFYIARIKKYIEEHFTENIRLDDIANTIGYSKYHMNRMFYEKTGQTIHNYIKERRLYEAAELLTETDKAIVEISLIVGYTSQQAFTRAFKQIFECTPHIYRNHHISCTYTKCVSVFQRYSKKSTNHIFYNREVMSA
jgi:AraC family multidrug resistance transcriptional activator